MKRQFYLITENKEQKDAALSVCPDLIPVFSLKRMQRGGFILPNEILEEGHILVRNLEQLSVLISGGIRGWRIILDSSVPVWNEASYKSFCEIAGEGLRFMASYELTIYELKELYDALKDDCANMIVPLYGRIPLMVSAGCVKKTKGMCDKKSGITFIKDRKNIEFPVQNDCGECINVILNSLPFSGHDIINDRKFTQVSYKIEFSIESEKEVRDVIRHYTNPDIAGAKPGFSYTTGHLKRKVY